MRGNAARAFVPALAVLALVAVVAVASSGSTPGGTGDTRRPSHLVFDTLLSLVLLLFAFSIATLVYAFFHRKEIGRMPQVVRQRPNALSSLIIFGAILGLLVLLKTQTGLLDRGGDGQNVPLNPPPGGDTDGSERYEPEFAWLPALIVFGLATIAVAAMLLADRRRRGPARSGLAASIAEVLDESLEDLLAEADPRRAVIAAYARLERVLGAHGLPKHAPETPEEYLARILPELEVEPGSIRRLTDLFTWAKFSQHEVDVGMKDEAIAALSTVRDELRALEAGSDEDAVPATPPIGRPA